MAWITVGETTLAPLATTEPKVTRTGARKPPPVISTTSPPSGPPWLGATEVRKKAAGVTVWMATASCPTLVSICASTLALPAAALRG